MLFMISQVRGILNKLTPEKFDKLSDDLLQTELNSSVILKGVIILVRKNYYYFMWIKLKHTAILVVVYVDGKEGKGTCSSPNIKNFKQAITEKTPCLALCHLPLQNV